MLVTAGVIAEGDGADVLAAGGVAEGDGTLVAVAVTLAVAVAGTWVGFVVAVG